MVARRPTLVLSLALVGWLVPGRAASAQQPLMRIRSSLWETVRSRPGSPEAAAAMLQLAHGASSPAERLRLLQKVARDYPQTISGLEAQESLLEGRGLPVKRFVQAMEKLQIRAGGMSLEEAGARLSPVPLRRLATISSKEQLQFIEFTYRRMATALELAGWQFQALQIGRIQRIQLGLATHRWDESTGQDRTPPRITPVFPVAGQMAVDPREICFQLDDGDCHESQCALKSLRFTLDGRDLTAGLHRSHFIDLAGTTGAVYERIEMRSELVRPLTLGPHQVLVNVRDQRFNEAARGWSFLVVRNNPDSELYSMARKGPDATVLTWLQQMPDRAFEWVPMFKGSGACVSPLWSVVLCNRFESARWLVERGVPPSAQDLRVAASVGSLQLVKLLAEHRL